MKNLNKILVVVLCLAMVLSFATAAVAEGNASYEEITTIEELTTGQYKLVTGGYNLGVLDGSWVTNAESVWTITVVEGGVTLCDANGKFVAPKGGNSNGIKEGEYVWSVSCENGEFIFKGQGTDTVRLAANVDQANAGKTGVFRGYKESTVTGNYASKYPNAFKLYKEAVKESVPGEPVCGHAIEDHREIVIAPTCTAYGFTLHVCTVEGCDGSFADSYVDALGHTFGEATCTEAATCSRCGETEGELAAHNITSSSEGFDASCVEDGMAEYYYCGDCGTYFADAECTVEMEDQTGLNLVIPMTGHNITSSCEGFDASCVEDGMIEYYYCGECNTYFADAECTTKLEDQTGLNLVIPMTGHNVTSSCEGFDASCVEDGMVEYYYCGECNTYFADAECTTKLEDQTGLNLVIPMTGHNITSSCEGFEASCKEEGMIEYYYCGECNTYFADAELTTKLEDQTGMNLIIPVVEHTEGEWVVVKEAEVGVDGLKQKTCTVCGEVLASEVIPALESSPTTGDNTIVLFVVFAMVAMTGLTVMVCKKKYF